MKLTLKALLELSSKGVDKVVKETKKIKDNLGSAAASGARLVTGGGNTGQGAIDRQSTKTGYRGQRGLIGSRKSSGRNFSGLAGIAGGGGGAGDGLDGSLVGAYAAIAANVFALTAAFQALSDAAKVEQLTQGLELMGARGGIALKATANGLREVTDNAISSADAMRAVAQASAAGLGTDEIQRLGAVARGSALALGRDMSEAMDRLTRGAIKLEPELLDELGIMVRLDEAVRSYAQEQSKAASSLTLTERRQAFLNAVLEEGERKFGNVANQIDANPYDKLQASVRDLGTEFFTLINGPLKDVVNFVADNPFALLVPGIFLVSKALGGLGVNFDNMTKRLIGSSDVFFERVALLEDATESWFVNMKGGGGRASQAVLGLNSAFKETADVFEQVNLRGVKSIGEIKQRFAAAQLAVAKTNGSLTITGRLFTALGRTGVIAVARITVALKIMQSVIRSILPMLLLTFAFVAIEKLIGFVGKLSDKMRGLTAEIKEARKGYQELTKTAEKTLAESRNLDFAENFQARVNIMKQLRGQNEALLLAYKEQKSVAKELREIEKTRVDFVAGDLNLKVYLKQRSVAKDVRDALIVQLRILKNQDESVFQQTIKSIERAKNEREIIEIVQEQTSVYEDIVVSMQAINSIAKDLSKNLKDATPRGLDTSITRALDNVQSLSVELQGFQGGFSDNQSNLAAGQLIAGVGAEQLRQARAIGEAVDGTNTTYWRTIPLVEKLKELESDRSELTFAQKLARTAEIVNLTRRIGIMARGDAAEAEANSKLVSLELQRLDSNKDLVAQKLKILNTEQKILDSTQKIRDLQFQMGAGAIGGSGSETGLVGSILKQNDAITKQVLVLEEKKNLVDAQLEQDIQNLRVQQKLLGSLDEMTGKQKEVFSALESQISATKTQAALDKQVLDQNVRLAQQQLTAAKAKLDALVSENKLRKNNLDMLQEEFAAQRQLSQARLDAADIARSRRFAAEDFRAGPLGLTQGQQANRDKEVLQATLKQLQEEGKFLQIETSMKLDNLRLEQKIRQEELRYLKVKLNDAGLDTSSIDTLLSLSKAKSALGFQNLERITEAQLANNTSRQEAIVEAIDRLPLTLGERFAGAVREIAPMRDLGTLGLSGNARAFAEDGLRNGDDRRQVLEMARALQEATLYAEGFNSVLGTVESSITSAFQGIITGSKSAGEAFKDMATAILSQIAQMIAQMIAFKILQSAIPGLPIPGFANGGIIPMANGGITSRGQAMGVVSKPTYLVGEGKHNEAVVPLPNGRSIPVQLHGAGGSGDSNTVTVHVSVEGGTSSSEGQGEKAQELGRMVSSAVQKELMAQKQPGGLLSKYG